LSTKIKVSEIADEAGCSNKEVIDKAKDLGIVLKAANSAISMDEANVVMEYMMSGVIPDGYKSAETTKKKPAPKKKAPAKTESAPATTKKPKEEVVTESKTEAPKEEKSSSQSPKVQKSDGVKVVEPKKEQKSNTTETLASAGITRKGIRIISKKTKAESSSSDSTIVKKSASKSMKELMDEASGSKEPKDYTKPKAKPKKKSQATSTNHGVKIDIMDTMSDMASSDYEDQEIMLDDLHVDVINLDKDQEKEANKKKANNIKTTRVNNNYTNQRPSIRRGKAKKRVRKEKVVEEITSITIPKDVRVYEFAEACSKTAANVISVLFGLGKIVTKNDFLEEDELEIVAEEFGIEVTFKDEDEILDYADSDIQEIDGKDERPPIITIMGHVDHGKTSLLDYIKNTRVAAGEAGGITQHIGAYQITKDGKKITFIDTPGHAAFTEMRSRGAGITDIVIIVVAADDGVKPQTLEAISHAKQAGVPIIVAVNKIDKPAANLDMVKTQMAEHEIMATDWGGDYDFVPVSAHTGEGVPDLLETILLQSEILELSANEADLAQATVVESSLEKGKGPVATIIVQNGTLKVGDSIVADTTFGKVRAITDDMGNSVKELALSQPGQIQGLGEVPAAGSILKAMSSEKEAKEIATSRAEAARAKELSKSTKVSIEELGALVAEGKIKALPVIIKADVQGSLEAIKGSLEKLKNEEVKINIIHSGVGGITESDIALASASENSVILGFNVRPTGSVKKKAKTEGVEIKTYSIIYDLLDDIKGLLGGLMSPVVKEENTGQAEVRDTFSIGGVGVIAGCFVNDGTIIRGGKARVIRDGIVVYDNSNISSLKRFKDDAKEVAKGYECGIMLENFNDIKVGDVIETFKEVEEQAVME
jgi:translation initiation factor IF-2